MRFQWCVRECVAAFVVVTVLGPAPGCLRVVRQESAYYLKGPHQQEPPDGYFSPGTKVVVLGEKDSYNRVLTFDGVAAHVWRGNLATLSEWRQEQQAADKQELEATKRGIQR